jgi:NAD(P)-dependent dehydrogenase (short-subunit alcohol dehydrogenase family)
LNLHSFQVRLIEAAGGAACALACDVSDLTSQRQAFQRHIQRWGRLDIAVLNAGIGESADLVASSSDDAWRRCLDVNLSAVVFGVRLAVHLMAPRGGPAPVGAAIMITASAGGVFPMPLSPVYSASKAGCVMLTKSLAEPLLKKGIRISALCPQFTDTQLVKTVQQQSAAVAKELTREVNGRLLTVEQVTLAGLALLVDPKASGTCLVVLASGDWVEPQRSRLKASGD